MDGVKLAKLGMVNSAELRKPKYARQRAAQNMQSSGPLTSRAVKIIAMTSSVIGRIALSSLNTTEHPLQP